MPHEADVPDVSIVVPCRGHAEVLRDCLRGIGQQETTSVLETIVVDSAADARVSDIASQFSGVRVVRSEANLLPGEARNFGVASSAGAVLAFIDADCTAESGWIAAAVATLNSGARLAGGPITDAQPFHPIAVCDNLLQFVDFPASRPDGPASHFPSCNLAIRRTDFDDIGGFRHQGQPTGEDGTFCADALQRWPDGLRFTRAMKVRHQGRTTLPAYFRHQREFGRARGVLGIRVNAFQKRFGRYALMILPVGMKRFSYLVARTVRFNGRRLPTLVVLSPLLAAGLVAWAVGFRRGLLEAEREVR